MFVLSILSMICWERDISVEHDLEDRDVSHVGLGQLTSQINTVIYYIPDVCTVSENQDVLQKRLKSLYMVYRNPDIILLKRVNFEPLRAICIHS